MPDVKLIQRWNDYCIAFVLIVFGGMALYGVENFPGVEDYFYIKLSSSISGTLSFISGVGIIFRMVRIRFMLVVLILSYYLVFLATFYETRELTGIALFSMVLILPVMAFFFWRRFK